MSTISDISGFNQANQTAQTLRGEKYKIKQN